MVEEITIADALTELKRIKKLLLKRNEYIARYSSKKRGNKDEIENQKDFIKKTFQSANDLIQRYTDIKLAINKSNLETELTFGEKTFSVAEAILFKQQFYQMKNDLYGSFSPNVGLAQVNAYVRAIGALGTLSQEQLEKLDMVPELLYDEAQMIKLKEENLSLYSFIDALIEKSNHATTISL